MRNIITLCLLAIVGLLGCQVSKMSKTNNQTTSKGAASNSVVDRNPSYKPFAEFNGDTLQYLNYNFVDHKEQYIGKPFSILYNDLEFPVKSCLSGINPQDQLTSPDLSLAFNDADTESYLMNSDAGTPSYIVIVTWEKPVSSVALSKLSKENDGNWTTKHEILVNKEIIKDVAVLKYINPQSTKQ